MDLTPVLRYDGLLRYRHAGNLMAAVCHLRVYTAVDGDRAVAIAGDLADNPGPSVSTAAVFVNEAVTALLGRPVTMLFEHQPADADRPDGEFCLVQLQRGGVEFKFTPRPVVQDLVVGVPVAVWPRRLYVQSQFDEGSSAWRTVDPSPNR